MNETRQSSGMSRMHLDPRTKVALLFISSIAIAHTTSLEIQMLIVLASALLAIGCRVYTYAVKAVTAFTVLVLLQIISEVLLTGVIQSVLITFSGFFRKLVPCILLGGVIIKTTRMNEFMAAMGKLHIPKSITVPITVMLRYCPMVGDDWKYIKDAMKMRDVAPSLKNTLWHPVRTSECIYVPMIMSASKVSDELSAAAVTRGIENPAPRSCLKKLSFTLADVVWILIFLTILIVSFLR